MIKRHGYYLLHDDSLHGDNLSALEAKALFSWYDLNPKHANKFDGCSVYELDDGTVVKVVTLFDFFSIEPRVLVHRFPFT
jgi:hypothetical protein